MYEFLLTFHGWLRYLVIILAVVVLFKAWQGFLQKKKWDDNIEKLSLFFTISLDIQLLIGLLLYGIFSPLTKLAFQNFGGAMKDSMLRYWAVEHIFIMLIAIIVVHVGRVKIKKASDDAKKFKSAAIYFTIGLILVLIGIPWPFLSNGRPLL